MTNTFQHTDWTLPLLSLKLDSETGIFATMSDTAAIQLQAAFVMMTRMHGVTVRHASRQSQCS